MRTLNRHWTIGDAKKVGAPVYFVTLTLGRHCYARGWRRNAAGFSFIGSLIAFSFERIL